MLARGLREVWLVTRAILLWQFVGKCARAEEEMPIENDGDCQFWRCSERLTIMQIVEPFLNVC